MDSKVNTSTVVTLEMSVKEAKWLKGVTQNPMHNHETAWDSEMRSRFWNALPDFHECAASRAIYPNAPIMDPVEAPF